jgi:hypothetical protein
VSPVYRILPILDFEESFDESFTTPFPCRLPTWKFVEKIPESVVRVLRNSGTLFLLGTLSESLLKVGVLSSVLVLADIALRNRESVICESFLLSTY